MTLDGFRAVKETPNGLEWSGPAVAGEAGVLADAQALVDAGLATWIEEEEETP